MSGLRLVEVGLSWPPETFLQLKLTRLARRGVDVSVGSFEVPRAPDDALPGVRLEPLEPIAAGERALRDRLIRMGPDVLHFEWLTVASRCAGLLESWDGPVVVSCHGSDLPAGAPIPNRPDADALRRVFARADAVHCVAEASRREALAFGLPPEKARLIRGAVDGELFSPAAEPASGAGFAIVSVGWLRWLKGHEYAVRALAELVRRGIPATLDVLGGDPADPVAEPSQRARILHAAADLGVADRVRLHGNVSQEHVAAAMRKADALLHASLSEGLPTVILEAMACGVPVVATDVGGTAEAFADGVEGIVIPPRDPGAAARALERLWLDPGLRERMGRAGRARVEAEFLAERQTDQWLDVYDQVSGARSA